MDKCSNENEQGKYIKPKDTISFFNAEVHDIMKSNLAQQHAFVEKACYNIVSKDTKMFTIDINKCRRNILNYSKYDYCLFTCFDKSEPFKGSTIKLGLYYIEFEDKPTSNNNNIQPVNITKYFVFNNNIEVFPDENMQYYMIDRSNNKKIYIDQSHYPHIFKEEHKYNDIKLTNNNYKDSRYFPLRGNSWVYHNMICYCLENNIIKLDNIKFVIKSSLTLKHDYYNGLLNIFVIMYQNIQNLQLIV